MIDNTQKSGLKYRSLPSREHILMSPPMWYSNALSFIIDTILCQKANRQPPKSLYLPHAMHSFSVSAQQELQAIKSFFQLSQTKNHHLFSKHHKSYEKDMQVSPCLWCCCSTTTTFVVCGGIFALRRRLWLQDSNRSLPSSTIIIL